eukprot:6464976-Amphidinium_carterae.2
MLDDTVDTPYQQHLLSQLHVLNREVRKGIRKDKRAAQTYVAQQLSIAWARGDTKSAWQFARDLSGQGTHGVRRPPAARAIEQTQWEAHVRQVWDAVPCSGDELTRCENFDPPPVAFEPVLTGARGLAKLQQATRAAAPGKATPSYSVPAEIWKLLLQHGVFGPALMPVFEYIQRVGQNPRCWTMGQGIILDKPGKKQGPANKRIINLLDTGSKIFYQALLSSAWDPCAFFQCGFRSHRSRVDAIAAVTVVIDRLSQSGRSWALLTFDLSKAFDMLGHEGVHDDPALASWPECSRELYHDLHRHLALQLRTAGGDINVKLRAGVLQGSGTGPRSFRRVFDKIVYEWLEDGVGRSQDFHIQYKEHAHNLAAVTYADDLSRFVTAPSPWQIHPRVCDSADDLQARLSPHRLQINQDKCEALCRLAGKGSQAASQAHWAGTWNGPPLRKSIKLLGATLHMNGSCNEEVATRRAAAVAAFAKYATFFRRHVPKTMKRLVFVAVVESTLLSALELRCLTEAQVASLESTRLMLMRKLLGAEAWRQHEEKWVPKPAAEVRGMLNLSRIVHMLRSRRLRWLAKAVRWEADTGEAHLVLASLFGAFTWSPATVSLGGQLEPHAPQLLRMLASDLRANCDWFDGFTPGWRDQLLACSLDSFSPSAVANNEVAVPQEAAESELDAESLAPVLTRPLPPEEPLHRPVYDLLGMPPSQVNWQVGVQCALCGKTGLHSAHALWMHAHSKHQYRSCVQGNSLPSERRTDMYYMSPVRVV